MATIRDVAQAAGVSVATVSAVMNDSAYVSPELRGRVLNAISKLRYSPSQVARNLSRGRTQLIALAVADLANPFYARIVWAAEAAAAAWGYALVVFNSDENPDSESRVLDRIRTLGCDGAIIVPVASAEDYRPGKLRQGSPDRPARPLRRRRGHRHGHHRQSIGGTAGDDLPDLISDIRASVRSPGHCRSRPARAAWRAWSRPWRRVV